MTAAGQDEVVAFLSDPAAHGPGIDAVERVETHAAVVFLAGPHARKMKRAVRYAYLDYSTLELRRRACEAEVALNRRTAPQLYLGIEPVVRRAGRLALGGDGEAVEWLVLMRRFPAEALLDRVAAEGRLTAGIIASLADAVAGFHREAEPVPAAAPWGGASGFRETVAANLDELLGRPDWFSAPAAAELREAALGEWERVAAVLDRRRSEGRVRRCHGDLHLRNVVLLDGRPTPFDAIEFSDRLAWIDVLDDVAFLLMDLDRRGLRPLANLFFNRYVLLAEEYDGLAALPLFLADRAMVRAKVAATTAGLSRDPARIEALRAEAVAYFAAARAYLQPGPPRVVAVGGVSGTGKSSLAARLAPTLGTAPGALHLRTDVLRKRLFGVPEDERLPEAAYAPTQHERVYGVMFEKARRALAGGHSAVLDGVFGEPRHRRAAEAVARAAGAPFTGIWLEGPPDLLAARIGARRGDASDAGPDILRRQLAADFGEIGWERVSCAGSPDEVAGRASAFLGVGRRG